MTFGVVSWASKKPKWFDETTRRRDNETKRHLMVSNKKAKTSDSFRGGVSSSRRLVVSLSRCLVVSLSLGLAEKMSKKRVSKNSKSTVWILDPHDSGVSSSRCLVSLSRLVVSSRCLVVSLSDQNLFFYNSSSSRNLLNVLKAVVWCCTFLIFYAKGRQMRSLVEKLHKTCCLN